MKATLNKPEPVIQPPTTVTLEMSLEEAQFIFDILYYSVIGSGRRYLAEKFTTALKPVVLCSSYQHTRDLSGYVTFS